MRWTPGAVLLVSAVLVAGCGNSSAPTPTSVIQSYMTDLGEGNYSGACAQLDHGALASLETGTGRRASCPTVMARCLPNVSTALASDQTQQLYANIGLSITRKHGVALVSGTAVAKTVKKVTLADERGGWTLTSPGAALERCRRRGSGRR